MTTAKPLKSIGFFQTKDQRYYLKHREKILKKLNNYLKCDCGQWTTKSNIYNHIKSKRHTELLKKNKKYHYCESCKTFIKNKSIHKKSKKHIKLQTTSATTSNL